MKKNIKQKIVKSTILTFSSLLFTTTLGLSYFVNKSVNVNAQDNNLTPSFVVVDGKVDSYEDYQALYDDDLETKYCISMTESNFPYVTFKASNAATIVTGYTLYTGNDTATYSGRNPKNWVLYGSNDSVNWTSIHTINDDTTLKNENKTGYDFSFDNETPYLFYKMEFKARQGAKDEDYNLFQLSEIDFVSTLDVNAKEEKNVRTFDDLKEVIENGGQAKLAANIELTEDLSIYKKTVELDLNGYIISGEDKTINLYTATKDISSILILSDSNPNKVHDDNSLIKGGIIDCNLHMNRKIEDETYTNKAYLYANGGTVSKQVYFSTGNAYISYFTDSMTTFLSGVGGCGSYLDGGLYYGTIASSNKDPFRTNVKKITFKNANNIYATEYRKKGSKVIQPKSLENIDNYQFLGWYCNGTIYDFKSKENSDLTFNAIFSANVKNEEELTNQTANGYSVKLTNDITLTKNLTIAKDGNSIILDLNGHVINGNYNIECQGANPATELTIMDSNPTATHTNKDYPIGGYINSNIELYGYNSGDNRRYVDFYANGGTIKYIHSNSSAAVVYTTSNTPTIINSVKTTGGLILKGGLYYYEQTLSGNYVTYKVDNKVYATVATNLSKAYEVKSPTKEDYAFVGWYNGENKYDFNSTLKSSITLTAKWEEDSKAPVGKITIGNKEFTTKNDNITFETYSGLENIVITATDNFDNPIKIEYLISNEVLTNEQLTSEVFNLYANDIDITNNEEDGNRIVYVRLTDTAGNVTYLNTNGIIVDTKKPTISGIDENKSYCTNQEITVSDLNLDKVTVNGKTVEVTNNKFTLDMQTSIDKTIIVTDKAGNTTQIVVKYGHDYKPWVEEIAATYENEGVKGHKDCTNCDKHFDNNGNEITDLTIEKLTLNDVEETNNGCKGSLNISLISIILMALGIYTFKRKYN